MSPRSTWLRAAAWCLAALVGFGAGEAPSSAQINVAMIEQGIARTVRLGLVRRDEMGALREFSSCSGSFVTPKGLVLTASHCVRSTEDLPKYGIKKGQLYNPEGIATVSINVPSQVKPVLFMLARFVADDPELDVALVRGEKLVGSGGLQALPADFNVPYIPIGDSDAVRIGEPVVLMGFPSVGGDTITVTRGYVTGFTVDSQGRKFEMKTDLGAPGFSGGPVFNERSEQVAVHQSSQVEPSNAARSGRATLTRRLPAEWAQYVKDGGSTAQQAAPVGPTSSTVILQGRVTDGATGSGIAGAGVWVLVPGASLEDPSSKQVVANAVTDGNGVFQTKPPVIRGASYPIIVYAVGYGRAAGYVEAPARGSEVASVGTITLQRQ